MKKIFSTAPYLLIAILIGVSATYAGSLTAPGSVTNTMYSLSDIYNLSAGTTATLGSGTIATTPTTITASGKTLTEIYDVIVAQINLLANGKIASGISSFGYTGTLYGDTDATKVLNTATYAGTAYPSQVLKTGQTTVYQTNDDGTYQKGFAGTRFTDNANGTITDNATGLMWIQDHNAVGAPFNATMTWTNAITNCEALSYASQTDWRLPNVRELLSIGDYGSSPAIDPLFTNAISDGYWSSTTYALGTTNTWVVAFGDSDSHVLAKSNSYYARCVRGG